MAETTVLRGVLDIFIALGVYDVILPFLLVFTVTFAILEKTRVLGVETIGGTPYPKKSLNAIVAFCIGFFVIASAQLVAIVTTVSAQMVVLLLMGVWFLLLAGTFYKPGEGAEDKESWATYFGWIFFIAILLMFANAIPYSSTQSWLTYLFSFAFNTGNSSTVAALLLMGLIIYIMMWITGSKEEK